MTDKTPAMPEPLHLFEFWWQAHMPQATQAQAWSAWTAAQNCKGETIESALQSAQPAEVSDWMFRSRVQDLLHLLSFAKIETPTPSDKPEAEKAMADIRAILALRPQAVPMTPEQVQVLRFLLGDGLLDGCAFGDIHPDMAGRFWWRADIRKAFPGLSVGHGITQRADGGEVE